MIFTRDDYIKMPSPIEKELKILFNTHSKLTIFDIGSCEGEDSIKYAKLFPNSKIYSIEALPKNLPILYTNLEKYSTKNVEVLPVALSDKRGKAAFYVSSGNPDNLSRSNDWDYGNKSSSLLPPDQHIQYWPWCKFNEVIEVETDTLNNVCKYYNIEVIDFLHMDVQGAELKVLKGAGKFLKKIKVIWLEVEHISLYQGQPLKKEVENFMRENGFFKIKDTVNKVTGDHLYLNSKYFNFLFYKVLNLLNLF
ncbi:FkbM family methyltransferase [Funiculus sociatus GB2-A5]|uniref:FkbM family methyltransferase n=1 Tax=Funiculus sociatus GB2-A5 TaxID=2933946 RepID=A0ABV0JQP2_9CYAN|nr:MULTISPECIES: FkbM family methyltransferase [unclassified Trichocoleus]MBD1906677.1 FkbM family methyltransferase [Trichocoleus sp. FACHB-832]MBD2063114.1 FkbM family methyltransferase [Trichocoleus sp. FACHB-6]